MATPVDISSFTEEQKQLFNKANSLGGGVPFINSSTLSQRERPLELPVAPETNTQELLGASQSALKQTEAEIARLQGQSSSTEQTNNQLITEFLSTLRQSQGREEAQFSAEQQAGIPEQEKRLQELSGRINQLQSEALAIPLQIQEESIGLGRTTGGVEPIQTSRLRQNAIQSLTLGAQAQALQGNIALARQQVNRAVDLEFKPIEDRLEFLKTAYSLNKDILDREDKKRSEQLQIQLDERTRILNEQKEERKLSNELMLQLAKAGASEQDIRRVASATPDEAVAIASSYLGERAAEEIAFERGIKTREMQLKERDAELSRRASLLALAKAGDRQAINELGYDPNNVPLTPEEIASYESQRGVIQRDIDIVGNAIRNRTGLQGSSGLVRGGVLGFFEQPLSPYAVSKKQDFLADANYVIKNLTFNKIKELSDAGIKLTPISEKELQAMGQAASVLVSSARFDEDGNLTGFALPEERVAEELKKVQTHYQNAFDDINANLLLSDEDRKEIIGL